MFVEDSINHNREDDSKWPEKNRDGRQELEIRMGNDHISFEVCDRKKFENEQTLTK